MVAFLCVKRLFLLHDVLHLSSMNDYHITIIHKPTVVNEKKEGIVQTYTSNEKFLTITG